jgi:hypothetical protein
VSAPLATNYGLYWWSVDGGGYALSSDGECSLAGTIGQPNAGDRADHRRLPPQRWLLELRESMI